MPFTKITNRDLVDKGVIGLPDTPQLSTSQMQEKFEETARSVIIPKFNNLIDDLEGDEGASNIGTSKGTSVEAELNRLDKKMSTATGEVGQLVDDIAAINADIQSIGRDIDSLQSDNTQNKADIAQNASGISSNATAIAAMRTDVTDLQSDNSINKTDISDLKSDNTTNKSNITALQGDMSQAKTDITDLKNAKHSHSNKNVLDKLSVNQGHLEFDNQPIGGGAAESFSHVKVGNTTMDAGTGDTLELIAGSNVTMQVNAQDKQIIINSTGGSGSSSGDMTKAEFVLPGGTGEVLKAKAVGNADTNILENLTEDENTHELKYRGDKIGSGDMQKSIYDPNDNGYVDSAGGLHGAANNEALKKISERDGKPTYNGDTIGHEMISTRAQLEALTAASDKVVDAFLIKQIAHESGAEYSEISIHTTESDFIGLTVTVQQTVDNDGKPLEVETETINNDGQATIRVFQIGTFEVSVTFNGDKFYTIVNVPYFSIYPVELKKEYAEIEIQSEIPDTKGQTATITSGSYSVTGVFDATTNKLTARVFQSGNFLVSVIGTDGKVRTKQVQNVVVSTSGGTFTGSNIEADYAILGVHTNEADFIGLTVTAVCGTETVSGTIDSSGDCELRVYTLGTYEATVTFNNKDYTSSVEATAFSLTPYPVVMMKEYAVLKLTTLVPEMLNCSVSASNGTNTYTGSFNSTGSADINVFETGTYTVTCTDSEGHTRTISDIDVDTLTQAGEEVTVDTFEIDYATIEITTEEAELFTMPFTATNGTASKGGTINITGSASIHVYDLGLWNITASGASDTASAKVNVTAVNETFEVRLSYAWLVGMKVDESVDTSNARITLLEDAASWDFATMNATTHAYDLGGFENWKWLDDVKPFMVHSNGEEDYALDPTDYSKKLADGTNSDVANTAYDGGAFCKIPKLYVYQKVEGNNRFVYFGETKQIIVDRLNLDSTEADKVEANGFIDELTGVAVENSHVWLPMFYGTNVGGKLKSIAAGVPLNTDGGTANEYTYISANGNRAAFMGGSIIETLTDIFYMMFGTTSSQQICAGYNTGGSAASSFKANAVIGKGQDGLFYGSQDNGSLNKIFHSIALGSYQLWMRDPYLIQSSGKIYVSPHYKYSLTAAGYVNTGITKGTNSAWTYIKKKLNLIPGWGAFSSDDGATDSTAYADASYYDASGVRVCRRFGHCNAAGLAGLSAVHLYNEASYSLWDVGASVLLFPPVSS